MMDHRFLLLLSMGYLLIPITTGVDGGWSSYGSYTNVANCSVSCGIGLQKQQKERNCTNPTPGEGGKDCNGKSTLAKYISCDAGSCPDPCDSHSCQRGGTKKPLTEEQCSCNCTDPYYGLSCQKEDHCTATTCANEGYKKIVDKGCECVCTGNWTGATCTEPLKSQCDGWDKKCMNGGQPRVSGSSCACSCLAAWHGKHCSNLKEDARKSISMQLDLGPDVVIKALDTMYPVLSNGVSSVSNTYCKEHVELCCLIGNIPKNFNGSTFMAVTKDDIKLAKGFPAAAKVNGKWGTTMAIYVTTPISSDLCTAAIAAAEGSSRKKRGATIKTSIPQTVLADLVHGKLAEINKELKKCCDMQIQSVNVTKVDNDVDDGGNGGNGDSSGNNNNGMHNFTIIISIASVIIVVLLVGGLVGGILLSSGKWKIYRKWKGEKGTSFTSTRLPDMEKTHP